MRTALIVIVFAFGFAGLSGCSSKSQSTDDQNAVQPEDSGADQQTNKPVGRIPKGPPKQ